MIHGDESSRKSTAVYRCSDDISNLRMRVKLRETSGSDDSGRWEEKTVEWQRKVFSKAEREFYRNEKNCVTDLEKAYHRDVVEARAETKFDVFTYVNDDDFVLREGMNSFRRETNSVEDDECEGEYDFRKSLVAAMRNPLSYNYDFDAMFIMADLGEYVDTTWIRNERILCTIKYDKKYKIMTVCPDFTKYDPYCIVLEGNATRKFEYFVDNVSEKMTEEDQLKEDEIIRKINNYKSEMLKPFSASFALPPKNKLQVYLLFEILWTKNFEYDTIYIRYFVDLPTDWSCTDRSQLQGITQTSQTKGEEGLAHFGHVFDVVLEYNIEHLEKKNIPKCPYLYLEIVSKDTWNRYRTEGLTYKNLPVGKPGNYRFELQCFRLIPDNLSGRLRRFFIGDCSSYNDISWIGLPRDYDGSVLNKYGTNTVGTGQIGVRLNVVHQSQAFIDECKENPDKNREIFERLNASSLVKSVEQVLEAFKRARKNMIAARNKL